MQIFGIGLMVWVGILMSTAVALGCLLVVLVTGIARRRYADGTLTAERATVLYRTIIYMVFMSSAGAIYALQPFSICVGILGVAVGAIALRRKLLDVPG